MNSKIEQLQLLQQNVQNILVQKQKIQNQIIELDSALSELEGNGKAYKIVGNIMIASSRKTLTKDLQEKKEIAEIRLKNFITQEERLKKNLEELQKEVVGELKSKNG